MSQSNQNGMSASIPLLIVFFFSLAATVLLIRADDPKVGLGFLTDMVWPVVAITAATAVLLPDSSGRTLLDRMNRLKLGDVEIGLHERIDHTMKAVAEFVAGLSYLGDNQRVRARDHFRRATEADPTFALAWAELASVSMSLGDAATAVTASAHALEHDGHDPDIHYNAVEALLMAGRPETAMVRADEGIRRFPDDATLKYARCMVLNDLKESEAAAKTLQEEVLPLLAGDATYMQAARYELALAFARMGDFPAAESWLSKIRVPDCHGRERRRWPEHVWKRQAFKDWEAKPTAERQRLAAAFRRSARPKLVSKSGAPQTEPA